MGVTNFDTVSADKFISNGLEFTGLDAISSPDAVGATGANPDAAEFDAVVLLLNEVKTKLNASFT